MDFVARRSFAYLFTFVGGVIAELFGV
jgi:hypothetical protein